jgi:dTDP-4-dehydrorhamnose reductase
MPSAAAAERQQARLPRSLEVWGGVECTINRVRDQFFSQLDRNGHAARADDLELIASLGVRAVRYPVLWERTAPAGLDCADWSWPDARLPRLRELSITPIAGLVHHGSGPPHTSLVDPRFAEDLARYARAVAERYPWLEWYTPVNEPLTTARFSALYGVWYPHASCKPTISERFTAPHCSPTRRIFRIRCAGSPGISCVAACALNTRSGRG